jgi:hypothetical protein
MACSGLDGVGGERCAHVSGIYIQLTLAFCSDEREGDTVKGMLTEQAESERGRGCMCACACASRARIS